MSTFRRIFGLVCFAYAAVALLSLFKVIRLDTNLIIIGFLVITVISFVIDALVARQERKAAESAADR